MFQMFEEMDVSVSGRNAETRVREKHVRTGKRENKEDLEKKEREAKKQAELLEKYKEWNKGVKQLQDVYIFLFIMLVSLLETRTVGRNGSCGSRPYD